MKKQLLKVCTAAAVALLTTASANAEVFTVDGINYELNEDGSGVAVASGDYTGDVVVPATVKYGNITYRVTAVAKQAFQSSEATSVTLPNTVRSIGSLAFNGSDIIRIELGTGVESIDDGAFSVARELKYISEFPACCTSIGTGQFTMTDSLPGIQVAADNPAYKSVDGVLFTKSGRTILGYPNGHGLEYDIPEGVDTVANSCFNTFQALKRISFPSTLKYVAMQAFIYCTKMETNQLPQGLEYIGSSAFSNCRVMQTEVPSSVKYIGVSAFNNAYYVTGATISSDLTFLGTNAFISAQRMSSLTFEENPTISVIPSFAFQNCKAIPEIRLPEGYTQIEGYGFSNCSAVKFVDLPSTLQTVDVAAFNNVNPDTIIVRATVPPTYTNQNYYLFGTDCLTKAKVFVPEESIDAYKEAWIWKFFTNYEPLSNLSGVADVVTDKPVATRTYYNLSGIQVPEPEQADGNLYIVRTVFTDGTVKTTKQLNR